MNTLHLTLKKKWFDMIASGEKKEEYREIKPYWVKRLCYAYGDGVTCEQLMSDVGGETLLDAIKKQPYEVSARNGYAKNAPIVRWQHKGTRIGEGKPEWGAVPGVQYFILEIGEIVKP